MRAIWIGAAGLNGAGAVIAGALARHLWGDDPHAIMLASTGVRYGMPHAAALLALAAIARPTARTPQCLRTAACTCLAFGVTLFSFSLYASAAGAPPPVAVLTPIGGTLMILGWLCVIAYALALSRSGSKSDDFKP